MTFLCTFGSPETDESSVPTAVQSIDFQSVSASAVPNFCDSF